MKRRDLLSVALIASLFGVFGCGEPGVSIAEFVDLELSDSQVVLMPGESVTVFVTARLQGDGSPMQQVESVAISVSEAPPGFRFTLESVAARVALVIETTEETLPQEITVTVTGTSVATELSEELIVSVQEAAAFPNRAFESTMSRSHSG